MPADDVDGPHPEIRLHELEVVCPDIPPTLDKSAARALLRFLLHQRNNTSAPKGPDTEEI